MLLCVAGVCILTYGDTRHRHEAISSSASSSFDDALALVDDYSGSAAGSEGEGSMLGDIILIIPSAFNALYAVEWKRLVPGTHARDSLVGLGASTHCSLLRHCVRVHMIIIVILIIISIVISLADRVICRAASGLALGVLGVGHGCAEPLALPLWSGVGRAL